MRPASFLLTSALGVFALAGCSANVSASSSSAALDSTDAESAALSSPRALVSIEETVSPAGDRKGNAVARFVRARDGVIDEDALRMVHASLALPAVGSCGVPDVEPKTARGVNLADLGTVSVRTQNGEIALLPRELPDVADLVSGVVYTSGSEGAQLPAASRYSIRVAGASNGSSGSGDNIAAFVANAFAPSELADVKIYFTDAEDAIDANAALDFTWDAGDGADIVYADVSAAGSDAAALRCAFADSGHGTIPADAWSSAIGVTHDGHDGHDGGDGVLTLHRLHREPLRAPGIDSGEVRFDFARAHGLAHALIMRRSFALAVAVFAALPVLLAATPVLADPPAAAPSGAPKKPAVSKPANGKTSVPGRAAHPSASKTKKPQLPPHYLEIMHAWHDAPRSAAPTNADGRVALVLSAINGGEKTVLTPERADGGFRAIDLERAAHVLREPGNNNEHPVDPRLLDVVYRLQLHFGAAEIRILSGYRTPKRTARATTDAAARWTSSSRREGRRG